MIRQWLVRLSSTEWIAATEEELIRILARVWGREMSAGEAKVALGIMLQTDRIRALGPAAAPGEWRGSDNGW